jgi:hypothetical protein
VSTAKKYKGILVSTDFAEEVDNADEALGEWMLPSSNKNLFRLVNGQTGGVCGISHSK